ncbi:MAG: Ig-like domain-containing protein [Candidatus Thermoplasmatota archaeon]
MMDIHCKFARLTVLVILSIFFFISMVYQAQNASAALQNVSAKITVDIWKIYKIDSIEGVADGAADWYYAISYSTDGGTSWTTILSAIPVESGTDNLDLTVAQGVKSFTVTAVPSEDYYVYIAVGVYDDDTTTYDDTADISGEPGGGAADTHDSSANFIVGAYLRMAYNVVYDDDTAWYWWDGTKWQALVAGDYYWFSGEDAPDGSTATNELDAKVYLTVYDDYTDDTAPTTTHTLSGTLGLNEWYKSSVTVTLSASDNVGGTGVAKTYYALDGGNWKTYTAAFVVSGEGEHTIDYYSIDFKNAENTKTVKVKIDTKTPNAFTPTANPSSWTNKNPQITFSTNDATSGIDHYEVKIDDGTFSTQTSPYTLPNIADGKHTITVRAYDKAGNYIDGSVDVYIDKTNPNAFAPTANPNSWTNKNPTISFSTNDATSGIDHYEVRIDNGAFSTQTSPYTLPNIADGKHTITVRAYDKAGNYIDGSVDVYIDTGKPSGLTISINSNDIYTISQSVTLTLSATSDSYSPIKEMSFSYDGSAWGTWEPYSASKSYSLQTPDGKKTVYFKVRDEAGNEASPVSDDITLDTTPPDSKVSALPPKSPTTFTVSCSGSDATSGIAGFDIQYRKGESGAWTDWQKDVITTSFQFTGTPGETYYFRSCAKDKAGNVEPLHSSPDAFTSITEGLPTLLLEVDPEMINVDETASIFVTVTKDSSGISGMSITLTSTGGTITPASGSTDSNGRFTATFTASKKGSYTITAKATKIGYEPVEASITIGVGEKPEETDLKIQVSINPLELYSGRSATITVSILTSSGPAEGAEIKLSASKGRLELTSGNSDSLGQFSTTYTAPIVSVSEDVTITVTGTSGSKSASSTLTLTIKPKPSTGLYILDLSASPNILTGGGTSTIKVYVEWNGKATDGVSIEIKADKGTISPNSGKTDSHGYFNAIYTSPIDASGSITLTATASYSGELDTKITTITVRLPPTVTIKQPAVNSILTGKVKVSGTSSSGVIQVQIRFGEEEEWHIVSGTTSWTYKWDTTKFNNDDYIIYVRAFDGSQYSKIIERAVKVANPPSISILTQAPTKKVSGTFEFYGTASPTTKLVQYQIDSGPWLDAIGTTNWHASINTRALSNGPHTINVRASDGKLLSSTSTIQIDVQNIAAPSVFPWELLAGILVAIIIAVCAGTYAWYKIKKRKVETAPTLYPPSTVQPTAPTLYPPLSRVQQTPTTPSIPVITAKKKEKVCLVCMGQIKQGSQTVKCNWCWYAFHQSCANRLVICPKCKRTM